MEYPLLYEINTRCWLRDLSNHQHRTYTLANVPEDGIRVLAKTGFTHIWLMGVWTTGPHAAIGVERPGVCDAL